MFKFVDGLYANKASLTSKPPASADHDPVVKAAQHRRSNSGGTRSAVASSKPNGPPAPPVDRLPQEQPASGASGSPAPTRSSTSFAGSRNVNERSESRASTLAARKLPRLSRKSGQAKVAKAGHDGDARRSTIAPLAVGDVLEGAETQGAVDDGASQRTGVRRMISQPFDFQHLRHTKRKPLVDFHRLTQHELMSEFAAAIGSQPPGKALNKTKAEDLPADNPTSDAPHSHSNGRLPAEQARKAAPPRPKRSDELLAETAARHADNSNAGLRHVRSADTIGRFPDVGIAQVLTAGTMPADPPEPSEHGGADGTTPQNLGGLGARQPTGAPQLTSIASGASVDPRWSVFATNGFSAAPATPPQTRQRAPTPYPEGPLLSPSYGKELERVPEEPDESRSQRASTDLQPAENPPVSPGSERSPPPKRSPTRPQQNLPMEPVRCSPQSPGQPISRVNSNASDTLGGFIHPSLVSRKSNSSLLSTATGRSRVIKHGATDSVNWEDEIDFAYEHHMEAHCDLDWDGVSKRETSASVETVPELDHSASSSARSTQDGSMLPPPSMSIDILSTIKEALSSSDASSGEETFRRRRKIHLRDLSRESFIFDDGRPDLGILSAPLDLEDPSATMSATTMSGSEVATPADNARGFTFPIREQPEAEPSPVPTTQDQQSLYDDVLASYETATYASYQSAVEKSCPHGLPEIPRRHDSLRVAECRPFQRASLLLPLPQHSGKHQKSASAGMVTDFAVATLRARLQEASHSSDAGATPRQSSRLSANNLKLHTMVSQLRPDVSSPSTPASEATEDPASISSSQASIRQADGLPSMAPSSTASDDIYDAILGPAPLSAPPIPQRSRSRPGRVSQATVPPPTHAAPPAAGPAWGVPATRKLHSASLSNHDIIPPATHVAHFTTRSSSFGTMSPVMTVASEEPVPPANPADSKALPPLPSPPLVRARSERRRKSDMDASIGIVTVATPISPARPASRSSLTTTVHSSSSERPPSRSASARVGKPAHHRLSSRSMALSKYNRQIRHWNYDFGAEESPPKQQQQQSTAQTNGQTRPLTQHHLPSQEILAIGGPAPTPASAAGEFVARQYSDMSSDQPLPMLVAAPPARAAGFSLFPASSAAQAKQKSKARHRSESARLERVFAALQ